MQPATRSDCRSAYLDRLRSPARPVFPLRVPRTPWEWAIAERRIGRGASPLSQSEDIAYGDNAFPWCQEPTDSTVDPDVSHTVLWWAAALGKTDGVVSNVIGWGIAEAPTNIMSAFPIEMQRDKYSRDVIQAGLIDATPCIKERIVEQRSRDTGNTISYKRFAGGSLNMVAAGSVHSFRGPRVGIAHAAEVDGMGATVGVEGDPVELLFKRCEGFEHAVKIVEGTCTLAPTTDRSGRKIYRSRIQYWYDRSDQRKWFCPCRDCGHLQVWEWKHVRWPKGHSVNGMLHCEKCDAGHDDRQRIASVKKGRWQATAPFNGIRGYWLNGLVSLLPPEKGFRNKIHQFIEDADRAHNGMDPEYSLRAWTNTFLAEVADPEGETEPPPKWKPLFERRESYFNTATRRIVLPKQCLVLTAGVDVQKTRLEVAWKGHGRTTEQGGSDEKWIVDHVIIPGEVQDIAVWRELERELLRKFDHEGGGKVELSFGLVDAGKWPEWIFAFLQHLLRSGSALRGRVRACRGSSQFPHPIIDPQYKTLAKNLKGHWVGGDAAKDLIYTRLRLTPDEETGAMPAGYMHFGLNLEESFFTQLTAEKVSIEFSRGEEIRRYKNDDHQRNEALDITVYAEAAFRIRRWNFDAIEAQLAERARPDAPAPVKEPRMRSGGRSIFDDLRIDRGGWGRGWQI